MLPTILFTLATTCLFVACGDDGGSGNAPDANVGAFDADVTFVCDPKGANPAMGDLFNAPLANDVEVITKEPQHPGDPGPSNLP
jgi:hypothetical protein